MSRTVPLAIALFSITFLLFFSCVNPAGDAPGVPKKPNEETQVPTVLIISEYVEGSSYNKALEISNIGELAADLTEYTVEIYTSMSYTPSVSINLGLTGSTMTTLAAGNSYVLVDSDAEQTLLDFCDQESDYMDFNGDDAVVLKRGDSVVDSIGCIGEDPGAEWTGDSGATTRDATLRRKAGNSMGDTVPDDPFDPDDEWDYFPIDTFDDLGHYDPSVG